jgi:hypothetical protein
MSKILKWHKAIRTISEGRNGLIQTTGILAHTTHLRYYENEGEGQDYQFFDDAAVKIHPITSKGRAGRGSITIPRSELDNFIKLLKAFQ